jgi:hypothetical protein
LSTASCTLSAFLGSTPRPVKCVAGTPWLRRSELRRVRKLSSRNCTSCCCSVAPPYQRRPIRKSATGPYASKVRRGANSASAGLVDGRKGEGWVTKLTREMDSTEIRGWGGSDALESRCCFSPEGASDPRQVPLAALLSDLFSRCLTLDDRTSIAATFCPVECAQLHCDPCSWSLCHASPVGNESPRATESEGNTMTPAAPRGCGWATKMRTKNASVEYHGEAGARRCVGVRKGRGSLVTFTSGCGWCDLLRGEAVGTG